MPTTQNIVTNRIGLERALKVIVDSPSSTNGIISDTIHGIPLSELVGPDNIAQEYSNIPSGTCREAVLTSDPGTLVSGITSPILTVSEPKTTETYVGAILSTVWSIVPSAQTTLPITYTSSKLDLTQWAPDNLLNNTTYLLTVYHNTEDGRSPPVTFTIYTGIIVPIIKNNIIIPNSHSVSYASYNSIGNSNIVNGVYELQSLIEPRINIISYVTTSTVNSVDIIIEDNSNNLIIWSKTIVGMPLNGDVFIPTGVLKRSSVYKILTRVNSPGNLGSFSSKIVTTKSSWYAYTVGDSLSTPGIFGGHASSKLHDGSVMVTGGWNVIALNTVSKITKVNGKLVIEPFMIPSVAGGQANTVLTLPNTLSDHSQCTLSNGKVVVVGDPNNLFVFDPVTPELGFISIAFTGHNMRKGSTVPVPNGGFFIIGGLLQTGNAPTSNYGEIAFLTGLTPPVSSIPALLPAHRGFSNSHLDNGIPTTISANTIDRYDLNNGVWSSNTLVGYNISGQSQVTNLDGDIVLLGGLNNVDTALNPYLFKVTNPSYVQGQLLTYTSSIGSTSHMLDDGSILYIAGQTDAVLAWDSNPFTSANVIENII